MASGPAGKETGQQAESKEGRIKRNEFLFFQMNFPILFSNNYNFFYPFEFKSIPLNILNTMLQHECINMYIYSYDGIYFHKKNYFPIFECTHNYIFKSNLLF